MARTVDKVIYRVRMSGDWRLRDLYEFPRAYSQVYAFVYCLQTTLDVRNPEKVEWIFRAYPFQGGYSIVNTYDVLQAQIPVVRRPRIDSIRYESPGWIDLLLAADPALKVAASVAAISGSVITATKAYRGVQKVLQDLRLRKRKRRLETLSLSVEEARKLRKLTEELSKLSKIDNFDDIARKIGNEEVVAKVISAQYRRLKKLADFAANDKARLPTAIEDAALSQSGKGDAFPRQKGHSKRARTKKSKGKGKTRSSSG